MGKNSDRSFFRALGKTCGDFARNSSLHGFQYLVARSDRTLLERCIWWTVQIATVYCVVFLVLFSWNEFMEDPTVTTLENPNYPVAKVPFPAISVCDLNKISKKRATEYIKMLAQKSNQSEESLAIILDYFGRMLDFASASTDEALLEMQAILDRYDADNETKQFNPYLTFRRLTQPCFELISNCSWNGVLYKCSDLFVFETTMEGFCCVFNYVTPRQIEQKISPILRANGNKTLYTPGSGIRQGLTFKVAIDAEDYFFPLISAEGANLHIFNSVDFPDTTSGALQERLVSMGIEIFIRLYATVMYAVDEVKKYSLDKRHCKFGEEAITLFGTKYSYSDCILTCRLKSMFALCQCIPFNFIKAIHGPQWPQCGVVDIPCMNRYREKWRRLYPLNYDGSDLENDKQDSLNCHECFPTCNSVTYSVRNDFGYLHGDKPKNYSMVHVFFESGEAKLFKQDVLYYWFEILSNFGGTCSLMLGVSLISIFELIYFFTVVLYKNYTECSE